VSPQVCARALCWLTLALAAAGCAGSAASEPATADVAAAQRLWLATRPVDYRFVWQQTCFCLPEAMQPIRVTVHEQTITAATDSNGTAVSENVRRGLKSIDALYAYVRKRQLQGADVRVSSDARGVPTQIFVDPNPRVADDELSVTISGYAALP
jgi:Family of unknown function (DUF6174)